MRPTHFRPELTTPEGFLLVERAQADFRAKYGRKSTHFLPVFDLQKKVFSKVILQPLNAPASARFAATITVNPMNARTRLEHHVTLQGAAHRRGCNLWVVLDYDCDPAES